MTKLVVPKTLDGNLGYRNEISNMCKGDRNRRNELLAICRDSPLYWMNTFGWTYRQRYVDDKGDVVITSGFNAHYPMITWPVQDDAIIRIMNGIEKGVDINAVKARDMGVTWIVLFCFMHRWLFRREEHFGVVSRKEDLVDSIGDIDSLFEKATYILRMCPSWMQPRHKKKYMHLHNLENNNTLAGESTNSDVGRGGRKIAYLIDEAAAIENGQEIENSLSQNTACQIWVSTHKGPGNQFYKRIIENRGEPISLPWWRHPEKAQGAHQILDENGRVTWTSKWYEKQKARMSPKALAQEVDMDPGKSGDSFFDRASIERHRNDHQKTPVLAGELVPADGRTRNEEQAARNMISAADHNQVMFMKNFGRSRWKFWVNLENGRPPQSMQFVMGIDIATGSSGSNSIISVLDVISRRYVAKFWDAKISPEDFAELACQAAVWFGGMGVFPFMIWESNGPGGIFGRKILSIGYPNFYMQRIEGSRNQEKTTRYGWHSSREKKGILLSLYRDALDTNKVVQHCQQSFDECLDYIYDEGGTLIPGAMREETGGGRELHGDHVIADSLCVMGMEQWPKMPEKAVRPPVGTFAWRRRENDRKQNLNNDGW